ncbi:MAG: class I SAM-dependent methyltransferase [Acidobacteriaceae bacterium]|nr:class I SAM-dependent methyltransferase [Acidobacteriaceae bacterium]
MDRTRELKRTNTEAIAAMVAAGASPEAGAGGEFDLIGQIELAILRYYGLKPGDFLIDVGCGPGRLAKPLSAYLRGRYSGFDIVDALVDHAKLLVNRPDWRFESVEHIGIPEPDGCADMVCFFSVFTHLLHEQSYWYLQEAIRVLKPGGTIVFSFLEFREPAHWPIFLMTLQQTKERQDVPINVFLSREAINTWASQLGATIQDIRNAADLIGCDHGLGQAVCVLSTPQ